MIESLAFAAFESSLFILFFFVVLPRAQRNEEIGEKAALRIARYVRTARAMAGLLCMIGIICMDLIWPHAPKVSQLLLVALGLLSGTVLWMTHER